MCSDKSVVFAYQSLFDNPTLRKNSMRSGERVRHPGDCMDDVELLGELARARAQVEAHGSGGGRLDAVLAFEGELDRRVQLRRDQVRGTWDRFVVVAGARTVR